MITVVIIGPLLSFSYVRNTVDYCTTLILYQCTAPRTELLLYCIFMYLCYIFDTDFILCFV